MQIKSYTVRKNIKLGGIAGQRTGKMRGTFFHLTLQIKEKEWLKLVPSGS